MGGEKANSSRAQEFDVIYEDFSEPLSENWDLANFPDEWLIDHDRGVYCTSGLGFNYLKNQGVDDIELLIATHPHEDRIGGFPDIFDAFAVEEVIDSGYFTDTVTCRNYIAEIRRICSNDD